MRPIWSPRSTNPLSLWFTRKAWEDHIEGVKVAIARDTGVDLPPTKRVAAGDRRQLRGIPVVGAPGGLPGTMSDTDPLGALLHEEAKAERRRDR